MEANQAERRPWWKRADLLSLGALLLLVVWAAPLAWRGLSDAADVRRGAHERRVDAARQLQLDQEKEEAANG